MPESYGQFRTDASYAVLKAFRDYDGGEVAAGTRFKVTAIAFLPYEDGLTLEVQVSSPGSMPRLGVLRLQDRPETQAAIIDPAGGFIAPSASH
jgi:hypothetical protein